MGPLTEVIPKALITVAGKTLLEWAIDRYIQSDIYDIIIAVGWKGSMIRDFVKSSGIKVNIVDVPNYEIGPLQTLLTALETFDGDFLLSPVDALIASASITGLYTYHSDVGDIERMILAVSSQSSSGTPVEISEDGQVTDIGYEISSSKNLARSAMMLVGNTRIKSLCRSALNNGKGHVVQLLAQLIKEGNSVQYYEISESFMDLDTISDLIAANEYILKCGFEGKHESIFVPNGDRIEVGDTLTLKKNITIMRGTTLQGPVLISSNCDIGEYCSIGPNATLESNTSLSDECEISNAILFGNSKIAPKARIHHTVIYDSIEYSAEV